jgi:hypothetical protein
MKKKANTKCLGEVLIHIERSRESFKELTFFTKLIKPPDR